MLDIKSLLPELKRLVTALAEDLLARSQEVPEIDAGLRDAYAQIEQGGRTADPFEVWHNDYLDQVAVAWVLGLILFRFMEDNGLVEECWLASREGAALSPDGVDGEENLLKRRTSSTSATTRTRPTVTISCTSSRTVGRIPPARTYSPRARRPSGRLAPAVTWRCGY